MFQGAAADSAAEAKVAATILLNLVIICGDRSQSTVYVTCLGELAL